MYEVFVHTKHYIGMEPRTTVSFEVSGNDWAELEETEGWKFINQFLEQKSAARANLTPTKIADGYAECDVRLVAGQNRDVKYVSERIVNIKELESYVEKAYLSVELLVKEIERENVNNQQIIRLLKNARQVLEKANNFEFCIERRTTL